MRHNPLLDELRTYPVEDLNRRKEAVVARGIPVFDFGVGDPSEPTPDFVRDALVAAVPRVSSYPHITGTVELRRAIQGYMRRRFGVDLEANTQILPTSGSKEAVFHLPLAVIDRHAPDRAVVFPDPSYPGYERGTLFAGGDPHPVPLSGDWHFRPWDLPKEVLARTRLMYINSPANPTGLVMDRAHLQRVYDLCREWDILLVDDECYADLYDDEPPPSLLEVGTEGVLVIHSLSKRSGMTGYRSGFIAGDAAWIARLRELRANPGIAPQTFVNASAVAAWSEDSHVHERRRIFAERRRLVVPFLQELGLSPIVSNSTFYVWFPAPAGFNDLTFAAYLLDAGIVVTPGRLFATTTAGHGFLRLALVQDLAGCRAALDTWRRLPPPTR